MLAMLVGQLVLLNRLRPGESILVGIQYPDGEIAILGEFIRQDQKNN
jgi:hypothetical protein